MSMLKNLQEPGLRDRQVNKKWVSKRQKESLISKYWGAKPGAMIGWHIYRQTAKCLSRGVISSGPDQQNSMEYLYIPLILLSRVSKATGQLVPFYMLIFSLFLHVFFVCFCKDIHARLICNFKLALGQWFFLSHCIFPMMDGWPIQSVFAIDLLTKFVSLVGRFWSTGHMFDNPDLRQWFKVKRSPHQRAQSM